MRFPALAALLLIVASPAVGSDGELEINQTCAVQTGCFPGDAAGLPVTITAAGSYRLTSDLAVPDENTDGIVVGANDVSLDLGGFTLSGPVVCSGSPVTCSPAGSGSGVERQSGSFGRTSVSNGTIRGFGYAGVWIGYTSEVKNLRVLGNADTGISVAQGCVVRDNVVYRNGLNGISAQAASVVSGNSVYANLRLGIYTESGTVISGNTIDNNGYGGIQALSGVTIVGNAIFDNGDATNPNLDDGIECGSGCNVRSNSIRQNSGYGMLLGADSAYGDNAVTANDTGGVAGLGSANSVGGNYCAGTGVVSTSCP